MQQQLLMGVINLTPNSFSDGGKFLACEDLLSGWESLAPYCQIIDVGGESTAPKNGPIHENEEQERLEIFFSLLEKLQRDDPKKLEKLIAQSSLSIDTYRPSTMHKVALKLKALKLGPWPLIWNDISGVLDRECQEFFKHHPQTQYVLSHNFSPTRQSGSQHLKHVQKISDQDLLESLHSFFEQGLATFQAWKRPRPWLDPGLGFAKSGPQNWAILKNMGAFFDRHPGPWLLGISRKSFLRSLCPIPGREMDYAHALETQVVLEVNQLAKKHNQNHPLCWRVHDPLWSISTLDNPL